MSMSGDGDLYLKRFFGFSDLVLLPLYSPFLEEDTQVVNTWTQDEKEDRVNFGIWQKPVAIALLDSLSSTADERRQAVGGIQKQRLKKKQLSNSSTNSSKRRVRPCHKKLW